MKYSIRPNNMGAIISTTCETSLFSEPISEKYVTAGLITDSSCSCDNPACTSLFDWNACDITPNNSSACFFLIIELAGIKASISYPDCFNEMNTAMDGAESEDAFSMTSFFDCDSMALNLTC